MTTCAEMREAYCWAAELGFAIWQRGAVRGDRISKRVSKIMTLSAAGFGMSVTISVIERDQMRAARRIASRKMPGARQMRHPGAI